MLKIPHQTTVHTHLQLLCQDLLKLLGSPKTPGGWDVCPLFLGVQHPQKQGLFQPKQGSVGFQVWMNGWMDVKFMVLHPSLAPPQMIFGVVFFSERIFFIETFHPSNLQVPRSIVHRILFDLQKARKPNFPGWDMLVH